MVEADLGGIGTSEQQQGVESGVGIPDVIATAAADESATNPTSNDALAHAIDNVLESDPVPQSLPVGSSTDPPPQSTDQLPHDSIENLQPMAKPKEQPKLSETGELAKRYLTSTVAPLLRVGLKQVASEKPSDPIGHLADFLESHHPNPVVKPIYFVFGVDGTGKNALCERLQSEFNWKWLEAGDVLRSEVESSESLDGKLITECIEKGKSVPTEVTIKLIKNSLAFVGDCSGVLLDGFPRKLDQAAMFEMEVKGFRGGIHLDVSKDIAIQRILESAKSHSRFDPVERFEKKWKSYEKYVLPIVDYYKGAGKLVQVDASQHPDDVFAAVRPFCAPIFKA
eukprot:CAMPEP_0182444666 /NCGR_PEP_ID=MMETSP1172-20130603/3054_1 /TAXON_ID=708627 /ORGANISM="Timspurckia oligopyrenoides, Strain CCMP3278" /LENGTH=338 /DNA_ID=CAMNT_0024640285 /DNA_START=63 /DNA_END=1079 /DNA_ORIENTATION=+